MLPHTRVEPRAGHEHDWRPSASVDIEETSVVGCLNVRHGLLPNTSRVADPGHPVAQQHDPRVELCALEKREARHRAIRE